jgi:RNA polymerase sigma factor (sigma-70 family)
LVFNIDELRNDPGRLEPNLASLDREVLDRSVSAPWARTLKPRDTDLSLAARGWSRAGVLAPRQPVSSDNPLLRATSGITAGIIDPTRPSGALLGGLSALAESPLVKAMAKFTPPTTAAVGEGGFNSTNHNASLVGTIAGGFRALGPPNELVTSSRDVYNTPFGNAAIEQAAMAKRTFSGQYVNNAFGFQHQFEMPSFVLGTQAKQGFSQAYHSPPRTGLEAFASPEFTQQVGKLALKYVGFVQHLAELIQSWRSPLERAFGWLSREMERWPVDPHGELVPAHNARLYRLAIAAYEGDPVAQARFLNEIGADEFLDNVSLVDELLKPTFDPERPDCRKDWWLMELAAARLWLRKRLRDIRIKKDSERKAAERIYAQRERTERLQVQGNRIIRATARDVLDFDPELIEFERQEREIFLRQRIREMLPEILPERQHQIFWYLAYEMTLKQIAHRLGLSESTVKVHAMRMRANLRANPELMEVLRLNGTLG